MNTDSPSEFLVRTIGPTVPQASFTFFAENIFPPLDKAIDIDRVIKTLEDEGLITSDGRWRGFSQDPKDEKLVNDTEEYRQKLEDLVFGRLVDIVSAIVAHSGVERAPTLEYSSKPTFTPISVYDGKGGRPDGHLLFLDRIPPAQDSSHIFWRDICTPAAFKLQYTNDNIKQGNKKICWSMQQIMHEDPRRRFVFAFTIQNTTMRVWFASRSELIVSEPFDFFEEKSKFIHFFLSQAFASDDELGRDPTMKVVNMESTGRLVYDVVIRESDAKEHVYRTKQLINDDATASLQGRGTRVWQMQLVRDGQVDTKVGAVLKDYWIDEDRAREGDILEELGQLYAGHKHEEVFLNSFLTVIAHGDVYIHDKIDNTRRLMTRGSAPPDKDKPENWFALSPVHQRVRLKSGKILSVPSGSHPQDYGKDARLVTTAPTQLKPVRYWTKAHYRILFLQVCKGPLSKETSLAAIFGHLDSVVVYLQLMHCANTPWVHRDVSAGNILIDAKDEARLADLEYAKRFGDDGSDHVRTGTAKYMAVEVDQECYKYLAEDDSDSKEPTVSAIDKKYARLAGDVLDEGDDVPDIPPSGSKTLNHIFRYNPLHDMESVLWVAFDAVVNRERKLASDPDSDVLALTELEYQVAMKLFYNFSDRGDVMRLGPGIIDQTLKALPDPLKPIGQRLLLLKNALISRYQTVEADPASIGPDACGNLYDKFSQQFSYIRRLLGKIGDVTVSPIVFELDVSDQTRGRLSSIPERGSGSKRPGEDELSQGSKKLKTAKD